MDVKSQTVFHADFFFTILRSVWKGNLVHYFAYDVISTIASQSGFSVNPKPRNAIVGAENLLKGNSCTCKPVSCFRKEKSFRGFEGKRYGGLQNFHPL